MAKQTVNYDLSLTDEMTVREVERIYYNVVKEGLSMEDPDLLLKTSAVKMWKLINKLRFTDKATMMKIKELREWASIVRSDFTCIHRANYSAHQAFVNFYDWYENKRKLTINIKRFWRKAENTYMCYQDALLDSQEQSSWSLLQDHMRLVDDAIQEPLSFVEPTILNVFIRQRDGKKVVGQIDDIELLAKASVPLLWTRVIRHGFADFFWQYVKKCGIDFSYDFKYAELSGMSRNFCWMLEQMGIKLHNNQFGDKVLIFFDVDTSSTIEAAWNKVMRLVRDETLADAKAGEAIEMNDTARKKYADVLAQENKKDMDKKIEQLSEKFIVKREVV